jgi:hypothetical protein
MGMGRGVVPTGRKGTSSPTWSTSLGSDLRNVVSELCGPSLLCVNPHRSCKSSTSV